MWIFIFIFIFYRPFQILYSRIAIVLWKSFQGLERHCAIRHAPTSMAHFANGKNGQHKNGDAYNQRYSNKVNEKKTVRLSSYQVHSVFNFLGISYLSASISIFGEMFINFGRIYLLWSTYFYLRISFLLFFFCFICFHSRMDKHTYQIYSLSMIA